MMSNMSQVQNVLLFQGCDKIVLLLHTAGTENKDTPQTHPSASDFHEYHSDTPRQPPDIPQTPTRHLQGAGDANRQQQTPPDTNRQPQTPKDTDKCCLSTAGDVCCRLLTSLAPWRCLGGVWEMSGGYLGVSEWYSWKSKALGCVWVYLGSQSLQYGAVTLFCHNPETKEYFAPETYWTSKYQNLPIFGFQKSLGLCSF